MSQPTTAQRGQAVSQVQSSSDGRHYYHHGRSPAAWTGSMAAVVAFVVGFFAFVPQMNVTLGIVAAAIAVVGLIAAVILRAAGFGQGSRRRR